MLNPELEPDLLAEDFARNGRVQIRSILEPGTATALENCLRNEVPWGLSTINDGAARMREADELKRMGPEEWRQLMIDVQKTAREGYQFLFNSYQIVTAYKEKRDPHLFLHKFFEFMNSPPVIDFARRVTGCEDIAKADAQATRYLPGHFLRKHNDFGQVTATDTRRAAYVFNLSHDWQADWGGLLQFLDEEDNIVESWVPRYNSLSLFRVPAWHAVSCVAPYATQPRLAVTGWFRSH